MVISESAYQTFQETVAMLSRKYGFEKRYCASALLRIISEEFK